MKPTNRRIPLADLQPHPHNYNRHPAKQIKRIATSLRKFGQVRSIVVWRNTILAGHGVTEAARSLGWNEIAADVLPDEYPEHLALAYVAADNELSRLGDPDRAALAAIIEQSRTVDDELLEAIGYDEAEYDRLLSEMEMSTIHDAPESESRGIGKNSNRQIKAVLYTSDVAVFEQAILAAEQKNRGDAIIEICKFYLEAHGQTTQRQLDAYPESVFTSQPAA